MGKLDNTLIIYINGDNGTSAEGTLIGTPNEVAMFNGVEVLGRGPAQVLLRRLGLGQDLQPHGGAMGVGVRHAVLLDQADRVALRRRAAGHGDLVAEGDHGQGRHPQPVPPRHRHRADDPRGAHDQAADDGRWHQAEPDRGRQHGVHVRQEERERAVDAQDAVLRDDGRPRDLPRRLDREHQGDASAVGHQRWRRRGSCRRIRGNSTTSATTGRSTTTSPRRTRPSSRSCRTSSGRRRRSTRCCRSTRPWRRGSITPRPSITAGRNVFTWTAPLTGTPNGDAPSHPQRLVQLQGRGRGSAGRRRRHADHAGRPLRRLRLLPAEGQAGLHLEPGRSEADAVGRAGRARARQAHARIRLQVRRPGHGHARLQQHERHRPRRHRRAQGRRQGRRRAEDGAHHSA